MWVGGEGGHADLQCATPGPQDSILLLSHWLCDCRAVVSILHPFLHLSKRADSSLCPAPSQGFIGAGESMQRSYYVVSVVLSAHSYEMTGKVVWETCRISCHLKYVTSLLRNDLGH